MADDDSSIADVVVVNDLYLIALCNGRTEADAAGLSAIPDEEYAAELQLQEVIMSSAMAAAARSSLPLLPGNSADAGNNDATAAMSTLAAAECSFSISPPPLAAPATGNDATTATSTLTVDERSSTTFFPPLAAPATGNHATVATSTLAVAECSSSNSRQPFAAPVTDNTAEVATFTHALPECSTLSAGPCIPVTFLFCKICMDAVPPSDAHCASHGCRHAFCDTCLAGYIGTKIQDRIADVKCPEDGCGSVLDPELCQSMLPREAFEAWCAALCDSMVLGAKKVYCPFKDCSAMMVDEGDGNVVESECPSCKRLFCAQCSVPWHTGVDCAEYEQLAVGDRGKEDLVVMEMAKGEKWKRCTRCKFFVQKSDGCLHITCRCGFEFCYGCGEHWGASHSSCSAA